MTTEPDDVALFIDAMHRYGEVRAGMEGNYSYVDRYRDFHAVFSTDVGKKVLAQIVNHCDRLPPKPSAPPQELAAYIAVRDIGLTIASWATIPPRAPVEQAKPKR
jgi:hypothetical protein